MEVKIKCRGLLEDLMQCGCVEGYSVREDVGKVSKN